MHQKKVNHTQKHIKNTQTVDMVTKYFVTMINTANLCKFIEEKMQFINSWKRCFKKSKIAKTQLKTFQKKTQNY